MNPRRPGRWGVFFLLTLALMAPAARGQRIGSLTFDGSRRSKAAQAERAAAVLPPSRGLSLPEPAAAVLPPLAPAELERLQPQQGRTPIGVHRSLPAETAVPSFSGEAAETTVAGAWQTTAVGRLWRLKTTSPEARALRIHFQDFDAGTGSVWIHAPDGQVAGPYSGRGMYGDGDFWSDIVFGESATIEYLPDPAAPPAEAVPFRIAAVSHIWGGPGRAGGGSPPAQAAGPKSKTERPIEKPIEKSGVVKARSLSGKSPSPPKNAARTLVPGQAADFSLGPVTGPTLFHGDFSFQLEVPEGAAYVTFATASDNPAVDMALLVRFEEDNDVTDLGDLVFDHRSRRLSGDEWIGITRYSDPPLQAGTYFVSLALYSTGIVAEGTVTGYVGMREDCHPDVACYSEWSSSAAGVAQISFEENGASLICSGTLLNNRQQDATPYFLTAGHCVDTDEVARTVLAWWFYQRSACDAAPPDRNVETRTSGARLLATMGEGLIGASQDPDPDGDMTLLQLTGPLPDGVVFQGWDAGPQPDDAPVTGIHHPGNRLWDSFKRIAFSRIVSNIAGLPNSFIGARQKRGYTEGGSSGSALFSDSETVIGALSFGPATIEEAVCPVDNYDYYASFSTIYPHIRQFIDWPSLTAAPASIMSGQSATLTLVAAGAVSAEIDNGVGEVPLDASGAGSIDVFPTETTTYTLIVTDAAKVTASAAVTVTVSDATATLIAVPPRITAGRSATLNVVTTNAQSAEIDNGADPVALNPSGVGSVSVSPNATTTYTLTVTDSNGVTVTDTATVTVTPAPTATLAADPTTIARGRSATLRVTSTNAIGAVIRPGEYIVDLDPSGAGSIGVSPTETTTYTLTVTDSNGVAVTDTATLTVTAPTATLTADPATIAGGQSATLRVASTNAQSATIHPGNLSVPLDASGAGSVSVSPDATTAYTLRKV